MIQLGVGRVRGRRDVGDPQVVAGLGAGGGRDREPAAIAREADAEVAAWVLPGAEDLDVLGGVGAQPVQVDPAVELTLVLGHQLGGQPPHVVVGPPARQERHGGVAGAVDRPVDQLTGGHVDHLKHALLGAADRELVGEQVALLAGLPGVQRRQPCGIDHHRVDQHPLAGVRFVDQQDGVLLAGLAAHLEPALAPPDRYPDHPGPEQLGDPGLEVLAGGPGGQVFGVERVLGHRPGPGALVVGVLEPAVGVGDASSVDHLDQVLARGQGAEFVGTAHGGQGRRPCSPDRAGWASRGACGDNSGRHARGAPIRLVPSDRRTRPGRRPRGSQDPKLSAAGSARRGQVWQDAQA